MKHTKLSQNGFHVIEAILIVAVIGAVGLVGWFVYNKQKSKSVTPVASTTQTEKVEESKTWQGGDYAIKGPYADADIVSLGNGKYRMYYAIQPEEQSHQFEVFSATSTDGKKWTKEPGNRKTFATFPDVIQLPNGKWRMYYQTANTVKSAISPDGLTFTDEPGTRIGTSGHSANLDNVAASTTHQGDDGTYVMVYRGQIDKQYKPGVPNQQTGLLFWATSKDGLNFTKKGIALDSRNDTLEGWMDGPDFVKWDDESIKLTFWGYQGVYESAFDGNKFKTATLAYEAKSTTPVQTPTPSTPPSGGAPVQPPGNGYSTDIPGDPTLMKIGNVWFMYYGSTGDKSGIHYFTLK